MHPLAGHKKYCPWRYPEDSRGAPKSGQDRPGWVQCCDALVPTERLDPGVSENQQLDGSTEDVVTMLAKVQRVIG